MENLNKLYGFLLLASVMIYTSCQSASGNKTGSEYMPDMAHAVTLEANVFDYYKYNRWGTAEDLHKMVQPRNPVKGTIARGMAGIHHESNIAFRQNGAVPYYYANTEEDRTRAMQEIIKNPYPITDRSLANGKTLYNIQCGICHGEKGDGSGYLVRDDGGKYAPQPANFLLDDFITATNGRFYHTIMHGRNMMGSYEDKLSYEERWDVIQYIRSLQAASKNLKYSPSENTLNTSDTPFALLPKAKEMISSSIEVGQDTVEVMHKH